MRKDTSLMTANVLHHWEKEELVGINCLLKNNGTVVILNCYSVKDDNKESYFVYPVCETTIHSIEKYNKDIWTPTSVFEKLQISEKRSVLGGEGGMGNEGFIAVTNGQNHLEWALFFTNSNPFYKISAKENSIIHATTSSNLIYEINIDYPIEIKITQTKNLL